MDETERVARAWVDACNGADPGRLLALLHPDVELHEARALPGAVSAVGREAVMRYLERFTTHWSSFYWEPLEWQTAGDRAQLRANLQLEGRKSGISVNREWYYVFTVRDGMLLRQDGYDDRATAEAALREAG
jgi:ketosteroid isomerase-like protein